MQRPLEITCRDAKAVLDSDDQAVLVDCREADEYALVSIGGAVLVPMSEIQVRIGELAPLADRRVIVYCHLGGRSAQVAAWLRKQGFAQAQSMAGGIDQWAVEIEPEMARY
jgi:rhodanese-related sulfurtransferase